jgi:16S rRNA processing protein RimM
MSTRNSGSGSEPGAKPKQEEAAFGAFVRKPAARRVALDVPSDAPAATGSIEAVESLPEDAVEVGAIVDAYGLKGWVKIAPHAHAGHGGDAMLSAKRWWLVKGSERKLARCVQSKVHSGTIVAQLAGCDDRDTAYALRGHTVHVLRGDFPKLKGEDEFYWVDLIGLDVVNVEGEALGQVADMIDNGAHSIMRVTFPSTAKDGSAATGERLIPFVGVFVKTVDQAARRIVADWGTDY